MNKPTILAALFLTFFITAAFGAAPPTTQSTITGRVLDPSGKPVPNAQLDFQGPNFQRATSNANGEYSATLRQAGEYRIGARAEGFITIEYYRSRDAIGVNGGQIKHDITMQPGAVVRVKVLDLLGNPMPDASVDVCLQRPDYRDSVLERRSTDGAGWAKFTVPPTKDPYSVIASKDEHEPSHTTITAAAVDKPQSAELTILPGVPIKGIAMCNDGKPASGWDIVAYPEWWDSNYIPRGAKIDSNGNFTLKEVGPGRYRLSLSMSRTINEVSKVTFPPSSQPIRLDLPYASPSQRVQFVGKVRITGGERPEYISVGAQKMGDEGGGREWFDAQVNYGQPRPRRATTGVATAPSPAAGGIEGTFNFQQIPAGTYRITFNSPQIEHKSIENVKIPGQLPTVELKVVGKSRIEGVVTDAATGKPVPKFAVRARKLEHIGDGPNYSQQPSWMMTASSDGKFGLELVGAGVYEVQASANGYAWTLSDKVRIEKQGSVAKANVKLSKGGALAGTIVDPDGKPVAGAKITPLSRTRNDRQWREEQANVDLGTVSTDARGIFTLKYLTPGDENIKISHDNFATQTSDNFKITDNQTADAGTIKLKFGGAVEGTVYDDQGRPAASLSLLFQDRSGYGGGDDERTGRLATVVTDANGKFRAEHLPQQPVFVLVPDGYRRGGVIRRTVRPLDGKVAKLDFGGATPVKGRLLKDGQPIANTRVNLSPYNPHFGPVMTLTRTDAEGRFTFMGAPTGSYTLFAEPRADGGNWMTVKEVAVSGEPQDLGDVSADVGDVVVTLSADDAADLSAVSNLWATTDIPRKQYQSHITSLIREGEKWRGKNVPVGKFIVNTGMNEQSRISIITHAERKPGEKETAVAVKLPRRSAELTVRFTRSAEHENQQRFALFQSEDGRIKAWAGVKSAAENAITLKLPPGKYQLMEANRETPREGVAAVEVKEGSTATIDVDMSQAAKDTRLRPIIVNVWDASGVIVVGPKVTLTDAGGKTIQSVDNGGIGPSFSAPAGKYKATVERAGKEPFVQEIDAPAAETRESVDPTRSAERSTVHIVLP